MLELGSCPPLPALAQLRNCLARHGDRRFGNVADASAWRNVSDDGVAAAKCCGRRGVISATRWPMLRLPSGGMLRSGGNTRQSMALSTAPAPACSSM